jgi:hypothetical protein
MYSAHVTNEVATQSRVFHMDDYELSSNSLLFHVYNMLFQLGKDLLLLI